MKLKFKKLHEDAVIPSYAKPGDAGLDLTAVRTELVVRGTQSRLLMCHTGLAAEIPEGYVGLLFPRSSVVRKGLHLGNSVGVIDSGYRGEISAAFYFADTEKTLYMTGERVAQLVILPIPTWDIEETDTLTDSSRGSGGFGSTGK